MNALARAFQDIFDPPPRPLSPEDQWKLDVAMPFLHRMDRLGRGWHSEDVACTSDRINYIGMRCFWAEDLGLIEMRRRAFRKGWWIRLTPRGFRQLRHTE